MSWWAFGWRTTCVALAVFATNFPSRFYWTGGAFLRWDWLFYFVGGICLVKKDTADAGRLLPRLLDAAADLPAVRFHGAGAGRAAAAVGDARARRSALAVRVPTSAGRSSLPSRARRGPSPSWCGTRSASTSRSRSRRCARSSRASTALPEAVRRRGAGGRDADAAQPGHQQRHRRLQGVHLQHAEAQGDAAHQPHGAAHGDDVQPVGGGTLAAELASRRSVGRVEAREGRHVQASASALPAVRRGLRRAAVRLAARDRAVDRVLDGLDDDRRSGSS